VDLLRELNLEHNTLLIVTGDNGGYEAFRSQEYPRGFFSPNVDPRGKATFRGGKGSLYEGGLRVMAFARWPGQIEAGTVSDLACTFSDMMPTFAEITGAKLPTLAEGISIAPTLLGREGQRSHEWMYWGGRNRWALRMGKWKALGNAKGNCQLYDLSTDVGEQLDVAAEHADVVAKMKAIADKACDPGQMGEILDQELVQKDRKAKGKTTGRL
jgi:arylsulfatase A-like enzyme